MRRQPADGAVGDRPGLQENPVAKDADQIRELVAPILGPGEEVVAIAKVNYNGTIAPNTLSVEAAIAGIDLDQTGGTPDPDAVVSFPSANQMALALTGGRLFCWSLGFSGKPKQYLGEVPLTAIAELHTGEISFGAILRVVMKSGAVVDLEFMKGEPAVPFTDAIMDLVGALPPSAAPPLPAPTPPDIEG
jgi:hypothetical protein